MARRAGLLINHYRPSTTMKLWQLDSILRGERELCKTIALSQSDWHQFGDWFAQMGQLVSAQDRAKLDRDLPVEFVRKVLSLSQRTYYLSQGQILRATQLLPNDVAMTALQAFDCFGGTALEDALEYGTCQI
jgi:hypothetical protein